MKQQSEEKKDFFLASSINIVQCRGFYEDGEDIGLFLALEVRVH